MKRRKGRELLKTGIDARRKKEEKTNFSSEGKSKNLN